MFEPLDRETTKGTLCLVRKQPLPHPQCWFMCGHVRDAARVGMEKERCLVRELGGQVSKACTSICMWVRAMFQYHNVTLSVAPKRAALAAAEAQREQTLALLTAAQSKLKVIISWFS